MMQKVKTLGRAAGRQCILTALAALVLLVLCIQPHALRAELVDRIAAVVNNEIIRLSDLEEAMAPLYERLHQAGYSPDQEQEYKDRMREEVLGNLIDRMLVSQEATRLQISVDDKEVDAHIEDIKKEGGLSDERLQLLLAQEGQTIETFRKSRKEDILRKRVLDREVTSRIVVTPQEVERHYRENQDLYSGRRQFHIIHIALPAGMNQGVSGRPVMEELRQKIVAGADADEAISVARASLPGLDRADLGLFFLEDLTPQIREYLSGMEKGQITPIMESPAGLQMLYLQDINMSEGMNMEQALPEIENRIYERRLEERFQAWLKDLRKRSYIKIIR
jgi:peptidyl-prolyl cis-trans isomerase SurA